MAELENPKSINHKLASEQPKIVAYCSLKSKKHTVPKPFSITNKYRSIITRGLHNYSANLKQHHKHGRPLKKELNK
jgi:hypothetical protein